MKALLKKYNITNAKPIDQADEHSITWLKTGGDCLLLNNTRAKIVITGIEFKEGYVGFKYLIPTENPKLQFARVVRKCFNRPLTPKIKTGKDCIIHESVIIGSPGCGFIKNEKGEWENFPHIGGVIIGDNVEIQANSCVDRGSLGDTIIGNGVKIDNLVHIAHNVEIGENTIITACAMIAGSVKIGKNCWIAPNASIMNGIIIGDNVTVGLGAVVLKDIPSGETWAGVPAKKLK